MTFILELGGSILISTIVENKKKKKKEQDNDHIILVMGKISRTHGEPKELRESSISP